MTKKLKITVFFNQDADREVVGVPADWKVQRFVDTFVKKLGESIGDWSDNPSYYEAVLERTESRLLPQQTMQEAGVQEGDVIRIIGVIECCC